MSDKDLISTFNMFDADKDGKIDKIEFHNIVKSWIDKWKKRINTNFQGKIKPSSWKSTIRVIIIISLYIYFWRKY